jgi:hypothetical protein
MSIDIIYTPNIMNLFTISFDKFVINKETIKIYSWDNYKNYFDKLYDNLLLSINNDDINMFVKIYYIITLLYINYTNFLKYIKHDDLYNKNIYNFINSIKINKKIVSFIILNSTNEFINNIIKINNPFFLSRIKSNKLNDINYIKLLINDYINEYKQMDKLTDSNIINGEKKILNIIIFRFMYSKNINYNNYHDFFIKKILNKKNNSNFNNFLKLIPHSKNILNVINLSNANINNNINTNINIDFNKILKFFINNNNRLIISNIANNNSKYFITNKKYGGTLIININSNDNIINNIEFNCFQRNLSLINYNIKHLKNINFLNKTSNLIEININNNIIDNISNLLHIFHLLTLSFKLLESYPDDLHECIFLNDYNEYYYDSICNFLKFIKQFININISYNKFMIDLIKYVYIYSYYDYYFYYSNNLLDTILSNFKFKNNIFNEFLVNLKTTLKLPKDLLNYPPFFNIEDDINSIIYYNFEMPNYFKLFDIINAIVDTFDIKINNKLNIIEQTIYFFIKDINKKTNNINNKTNNNNNNKTNNINNNSSNSSENETTSSNNSSNNSNNNSISDIVFDSDNELKSKIDETLLSKNDKDLLNNNNTYIELNIENSANCLFNTEIN